MATQQKADPETSQNGHEEDLAAYEQKLADYLQERIKPGLNSGAIPLLVRSIAKEIAHWEHPTSPSEDAEAEAEPRAEEDDEHGADSEAPPDFEDDMHELQAKLGEDWILSFSVHGDEGWLTAERGDGSQRLEAQTAAVLLDAVELLNEGGGRST
jgi:hypothetical protein